jgi:hypothetical protein
MSDNGKSPITAITEQLNEHRKRAVAAMKQGDVKAARKASAIDSDLAVLARIAKRLDEKYYDTAAAPAAALAAAK